MEREQSVDETSSASTSASTRTVYVESSALVAAVLESDASARDALNAPVRHVSSALTFAEAHRAVLRARSAGRLAQVEEQEAIDALHTFELQCSVIDVTAAVLQRAGRLFPLEPVRTLDAIHLASAEMLGEPAQFLTVLTRDARVRDNARALGHPVI